MTKPLRIAHIADLHAGIDYPGPVPGARFADTMHLMNFITAVVREKAVDVVVLAGDLFKDSRIPLDRAAVEIQAVNSWLHSMYHAGCMVFAISGTPSHDAQAAYKLLNDMRPGELNQNYIDPCMPVWKYTVTTEPYALEIDDLLFNGQNRGGLELVGLPGANRSNIVTREEFRTMDAQQVHAAMTGYLRDMAQGLRIKHENAFPRVLVAHYTFQHGNYGFDQVMQKNEPILTEEAIQGYALVCLGHIHTPQRVEYAGDTPVFYAGCPDRLSFGDEDNTPGFWIHEIADGKYSTSEFVETPARPYVTLHARPEGDRLYYPPGQKDIQSAVVRVMVEDVTPEDAKLLVKAQIIDNLYSSGAFFVDSVNLDVDESRTRARDVTVTESVGPDEAVRLWSTQQGHEGARTEKLVKATRELLAAMGVN